MGLLDKATQAVYYERGNYGNYQFTSLNDIITQFQIAYVGEDKLISKMKRVDIAFHAQRAMQELSFDTFKSIKSQEIEIPASLTMILPNDYVNYTGISRVDSAGVKHPLYPTNRTSNPFRPQTDSDGKYIFNEKTSTESTLKFAPEGEIYASDLIESGNLLENGNFMGGTYHWKLNCDQIDNTATATTTTDGDTADPLTDQVGWFWSGNSIIGYNIPAETMSLKQVKVPILNGEEYEITYTVSGYSTGEIKFEIVDQLSDVTTSTSRTANGTYTETLTAGDVAVAPGTSTDERAVPSCITFYTDSTTAFNGTISDVSIIRVGDGETSTTWSSYKSTTPSENNNDDYIDDTYWPADGERYGLDPQHAQTNGSFFIDQQSGKIHFSSNVSGKTIVLDYISDGIGTEEEMQVHKFAEEAMYKCIAYAIMSTRANVPPSQVNRLRRERFAAVRTAKLRLSNIKLEELTQTLRGKSKHIKH